MKTFRIIRTVEYICEVEAETVEEAKQTAMKAPIDGGSNWDESEIELYTEEL